MRLDARRQLDLSYVADALMAKYRKAYRQRRYERRETRLITIALHSIAGALLRTITRAQLGNAGEHAVTIALDGLQPGMYLAVIRTDVGESAVQRVIVVE